VQAALNLVVRNTHRIDEVITSIRKMFGGKSGKVAVVSIDSLVGEALALTQGELEGRHVALRNTAAADAPAVLVDRVQLQQVLVNLIMNAVEAMREVSGRERQLTIGTDVGVDQVTITVADTGSGIDTEKLERIFEPFFTTKSEGMGLGLAICRSIIDAHGGKLWVSPNVPFGTVFHVALPRAEAGQGD
jgi:signal transduction histidine kinase